MTQPRPPACGLFVLGLGASLATFGNDANAGTATAAGPEASAAPLTLEALSATRQRPLFSPTRHPPIVPVAPPPPPPPEPVATRPPPPSAVLIGVIVGPAMRLAILKPDNGSKPQTLRENQLLDGWTVETIEWDRVILAYQGDRSTLKLRPAQVHETLERDVVTQPPPMRWHQRRDPRTRQ